MQNYTIETIINRENPNKRIPLVRHGYDDFLRLTPGGGLTPTAVEGMCRADPKNPNGNRTIEWYDENVLKPLIESGKISNGSKGGFDDRKMRYDGGLVFMGNNTDPRDTLVVKLGHSHFLEYREKRNRTKEETQELTSLGIEYFNDPYAFFPRNPGVTGIIKTLDKKIIVGRRNVEPDRYERLLQGVAGHLEFREDPHVVYIEDDMLRELEEEAGIIDDQVKLEFLGLFSDPSVGGDDLDFTYLITTNLPSEYFTSKAWREKVVKPEHSDFYAVDNYESLQELVKTGNFKNKDYDIIFSTRGPLETLTEQDFQ